MATTQLWQRIRLARRNAELTQDQLGHFCGVSRGAVAQWESNKPGNRTSPSVEHLRKVADATKVPLDWLMSDEGETLHPWNAPTADRPKPVFSMGGLSRMSQDDIDALHALEDEENAVIVDEAHHAISSKARTALIAESEVMPDLHQAGKHFIFAKTVPQIVEKLRAVKDMTNVHLVLVDSPIQVHVAQDPSDALGVVIKTIAKPA